MVAMAAQLEDVRLVAVVVRELMGQEKMVAQESTLTSSPSVPM
jgi:hypothetical protein